LIELDRDEPVSYPEPISYITSHKTEKQKSTVSKEEKVEIKKVESKPKPKPKVEIVHEVAEVKVIEEPNKKVGHIMAEYWFSPEEIAHIGNRCDYEAPNPFHCKAMITHTCNQETKCGTTWVGTRYNLFGVYNSNTKRFDSYPSRIAAIDEWVDKYLKYWYNNSCPQMISRSRYCVSGCNDWVPNCEFIFNKFESD